MPKQPGAFVFNTHHDRAIVNPERDHIIKEKPGAGFRNAVDRIAKTHRFIKDTPFFEQRHQGIYGGVAKGDPRRVVEVIGP